MAQSRHRRRAIDVGLLLSLDLHAIRTNIYLEALRLLSILIEIVTKHSDHNDQYSDDQEQHVSIAEHWYPLHYRSALPGGGSPGLSVVLRWDRSRKLLISCGKNRAAADQPRRWTVRRLTGRRRRTARGRFGIRSELEIYDRLVYI